MEPLISIQFQLTGRSTSEQMAQAKRRGVSQQQVTCCPPPPFFFSAFFFSHRPPTHFPSRPKRPPHDQTNNLPTVARQTTPPHLFLFFSSSAAHHAGKNQTLHTANTAQQWRTRSPADIFETRSNQIKSYQSCTSGSSTRPEDRGGISGACGWMSGV